MIAHIECSLCSGTGRLTNKTCPNCAGKGEIETEQCENCDAYGPTYQIPGDLNSAHRCEECMAEQRRTQT